MPAVLLSLLCLAGAAAASTPTGPGRSEILLNDGWSYREASALDPSALDRTPGAWTPVTLPHTWNRDDVMDEVPGYRRGAGWYRRTLTAPANLRTDRVILVFEGVNMKADVYVNGRRAGGHVGGYVGFEVDITPGLRPGRSNTLLVRADNGIDPDVIPSQKSDFFLYGGITRNVRLRRVPDRHMLNVAVTTPQVSREKASTRLEITVRSEADRPVDAVFEVTIIDPTGARSGSATVSSRIPRGSTTVEVDLPELADPRLWSPAHPHLYTATAVMKVGGGTVDEVRERYGYRWFEFREHGPFFLNGERLLLRGTHRHEEWSGFGNALPDSLHRREMTMIREMGANFVRLAHYPQAPEVYRACDELGLLVWDELPWCRGGMGGDAWKSTTERLLTEMILQNRNHPSVIIWSLGNEVDWLPDVPGGDNVDSLRAMLARLHALARRLDPSRVTATRRFDEGADLVDVHSSSIWPGWYSASAGYGAYGKFLTDARRKFPRFFHAEYGGDSHPGRHTELRVGPDGMLETAAGKEKRLPVAANGDWSESYMVDLFDAYLRTSESMDSLTGTAQWIFKDFGTPLRPENPIPYVNQKGLCDMAGRPKDAYYVFRSYWTEDPKFCYIESPTWTDRSGPPGATRQVRVFSNCEEVELIMNGAALGRRVRNSGGAPAAGRVWDVAFSEGENTLTAVGYAGGTGVTRDSLRVRYTTRQHGQADDIRLSSRVLPGGNLLITAVVVDKAGLPCTGYSRRIYFSLMGGGRLLTGFGTPTRSSVIEAANGRAQIECVPDPAESGTLEVRNQDLKGAYITVSSGAGSGGAIPDSGRSNRLRANED
jgi:beta-galactosidase